MSCQKERNRGKATILVSPSRCFSLPRGSNNSALRSFLASVQLDVYDRHGDGVAAVVCWDSVDKDFLVNARMGWGPRGFHSRLAMD